MSSFKENIAENIKIHKKLINKEKQVRSVIDLFYQSLKKDKTIFICGNGGSASDSEHLSTEFLVRLRPNINRKPYKIINLANNLSYITACSNDYSFNDIFSRSLEALGKNGDVLWAISTSGNSKNIIKVLHAAKKLGINTVGFFGKSGGMAKKYTKYPILVESNITARIQECHIFLGHYILESVENLLIMDK